MIPFLIGLALFTAAFVALGVTYDPPDEPNTKPIPYTHPHKEQAP